MSYRVIANLNYLNKDETVLEMIPRIKEIHVRTDEYGDEFKEEEIVEYSYLVKKIDTENEILKELQKFIKTYQGNGIVKATKTQNAYKIFKAFSYFDLLNQLKKFEENLIKDWKIISDLNEEKYGDLTVYWVEAANIDNKALEIF
jgi:hypothetical protein